MEQFYRAQHGEGLSDREIRQAPLASLGQERHQNVLIIPPDFTRYHSNAGFLTNLYYHFLLERGCRVDILPALGIYINKSRICAGGACV